MRFLVTGGAGYIGSHMVKFLQKLRHDVNVIDDFSTGNEWSLKDCQIFNLNLQDRDALALILNERVYDCIFHFAGSSISYLSIQHPLLYEKNNLQTTSNLIECMKLSGNKNLIFSSSAAVYGNPSQDLITEDHPLNPTTPYGESKLSCENLIKNYSDSNQINSISLRYFNAAGANEEGTIGEYHVPETHLIPSILNSLLHNEKKVSVHGSDFNTPDGTCIRDYIHVDDLVFAHYMAFKKINYSKNFSVFNLGSGKGFSVLEIIKACENVTGKKINYKICDRRLGDVARLVADNSKAHKVLDWKIKYKEIDKIVETAWRWHKSLYKNT